MHENETIHEGLDGLSERVVHDQLYSVMLF